MIEIKEAEYILNELYKKNFFALRRIKNKYIRRLIEEIIRSCHDEEEFESFRGDLFHMIHIA